MSAIVFDGKKEAEKIAKSIELDATAIEKTLGRKPKMVAIRVSDDPASDLFISEKRKAADKLGIELIEKKINRGENLGETFSFLNKDETIDGYYVQLPIPAFDPKWWEKIDIRKDIEVLGSDAMGRLVGGTSPVLPPTPMAVMHAISTALNIPVKNLDLSGINIVIVSRSRLIGLPLMHMLIQRKATVTVCHKQTKNLSALTQNADILISATGQPGLITGEMVKHGVIAIDLGTNIIKEKGKNKVLGDLDYPSVESKASFITPPVGGLGPVVVAILLKNLVELAALQNKPSAKQSAV